jgi:hypothetical protein
MKISSSERRLGFSTINCMTTTSEPAYFVITAVEYPETQIHVPSKHGLEIDLYLSRIASSPLWFLCTNPSHLRLSSCLQACLYRGPQGLRRIRRQTAILTREQRLAPSRVMKTYLPRFSCTTQRRFTALLRTRTPISRFVLQSF